MSIQGEPDDVDAFQRVPDDVDRDGKVIIAGTGRAGTTLLVQILTDLGADTGFGPDARIDPGARAGLEKNVLAPNAPRVVKSPRLSTTLRPLLEEGAVRVDHVLIPMRDLDVAAASRIRVAGYGSRLSAWGGFWGTKRASRQRDALAGVLYELVYTIAVFDLPHTFLVFPRFAEDPEYAYRKLSFLCPERTPDDFRRVIESRVDHTLIHETPLDRSEVWRSRLLAPVALLRRAAAGVMGRIRSRAP